MPAPAATIFDTNVRGTWNVLEAAHATSVRRVVVCSSVSALGIDFTNPRLPPAYLPIDEAHPLRPTQAYGLSKQLGEEIARSFARRGAMAVTCLRPAWVMFPDVLGSLVARLRTGPETGPGPPPAGGAGGASDSGTSRRRTFWPHEPWPLSGTRGQGAFLPAAPS